MDKCKKRTKTSFRKGIHDILEIGHTYLNQSKTTCIVHSKISNKSKKEKVISLLK